MKKKQYVTPACKMVQMRKRAHLLNESGQAKLNSRYSTTETDI